MIKKILEKLFSKTTKDASQKNDYYIRDKDGKIIGQYCKVVKGNPN